MNIIFGEIIKNVKFYFSANKNLTNTELLLIEIEREGDRRTQRLSSLWTDLFRQKNAALILINSKE